MPLRYHKFQSGTCLSLDIVHVNYIGNDGNGKLLIYDGAVYGYGDDIEGYLGMYLPSFSLARYVIGNRVLFRYDRGMFETFDKIIRAKRTDLIRHIVMAHIRLIGNINSILEYSNIYTYTEVVGLLKYLGFKFGELTTYRMTGITRYGIQIILELSDYTPRDLLNQYSSHIDMSAVDYLADLCGGGDVPDCLIKSWHPGAIRLLHGRGFRITEHLLDLAVECGRYTYLVDIIGGVDHNQGIDVL